MVDYDVDIIHDCEIEGELEKTVSRAMWKTQLV